MTERTYTAREVDAVVAATVERCAARHDQHIEVHSNDVYEMGFRDAMVIAARSDRSLATDAQRAALDEVVGAAVACAVNMAADIVPKERGYIDRETMEWRPGMGSMERDSPVAREIRALASQAHLSALARVREEAREEGRAEMRTDAWRAIHKASENLLAAARQEGAAEAMDAMRVLVDQARQEGAERERAAAARLDAALAALVARGEVVP